MAWTDDLQPASWNKISFYVDGAEMRAGRNTATHAYPFREQNPVWVEDLGQAGLTHRITGFLIGDDVASQQLDMLHAVQQPGQGELVHPLLGSLTGSIVGGCSFTLRKDRGRYVELSFEFVENRPGSPYPAVKPDTQSDVANKAETAKAAVAADYSKSTGAAPSALTKRNNSAGNFNDPGSAIV